VTRVYFATNRQPDPTTEGGYGAEIVAMMPDAIVYDAIDVTNVDLNNADSGKLGASLQPTRGGFATPLEDEITNSGRNLFVFIHGFANAFADRARSFRRWPSW
jgi:esterase/lipase superfamily enzyme